MSIEVKPIFEDGLTPGDFQRAIDIQEACNLSGIAHSFSSVLPRILVEARMRAQGTEWVNTHPISVMYTSKMVSLAGHDCLAGDVGFDEAYDACALSAKGKGGEDA